MKPRKASALAADPEHDRGGAIFDALATGGRVVLPLEQTFWAARFGVLVDQFGIPWQIDCEGSDAHPTD